MRRLLACATVVSALLIAACGPSEKVFGMEIGGADTTAVGVPSSVSVSLDIDSESGDRPGLDEMEAVKNYSWSVSPPDGATVGPSSNSQSVAFVARKPGVYVITAVGLSGETKGMGATHTVTVLAPSPSPAPGATDSATVTAAPSTASPEPTADPTISFLLSDGKVQASGAATSQSGLGAAIAELEIKGTSGLEGSPIPLEGSVPTFPFTVVYDGTNTSKGTASLVVHGSADLTTRAVTGTFTYKESSVVTSTATITVMELSVIWTGDVTGTIDPTTAALSFDGPIAYTCMATAKDAESEAVKDCSTTKPFELPVTFTVTGLDEYLNP